MKLPEELKTVLVRYIVKVPSLSIIVVLSIVGKICVKNIWNREMTSVLENDPRECDGEEEVFYLDTWALVDEESEYQCRMIFTQLFRVNILSIVLFKKIKKLKEKIYNIKNI